MNDKSPKHYLIAATIWTVISLFAITLLLISTASFFTKACGIVLVIMCVSSQWLRFRKFNK